MIRSSLVSLAFVGSLAVHAQDWIVTARYVVTMDAQRRVIENGAVLIRGDSIVAVGSEQEVARTHKSGRRLAAGNAILAPGLINTHTHAPMSLFRGIADDMRLQEWLEKFIFQAEAKNVSPEFVRAGTRLACLEMLLGGTTTFADMYYFEDLIAEETKAAGMRGVLGQTVIRFPVADAKTPEEGLARSEKFLARFKDDPLIVPAVAPHAVYTNSDQTLKAARALADKFGMPLLIHLSETKRENDDLSKARSVSPTALLDQLGVLSGRTLAAHGVWVSDADLATLKRRGTGVAHCPSSNMKLASGVAPVLTYLANDIAIGIGTDGVAGSNNDVSMFEEMDLAAKLHKVTALDPQALPAKQVFEMATIRGARALGMENRIGSLEPGKKADLITVSLDEPHATPMYDVYSHLVYALKASDVQDVFVNGKQVVRGRRVLTLDRAKVLGEAELWKKRIQNSLSARN